MLSAANIQVVARARALASSGNSPAWCSAMWKAIAPVSNRARSPSYASESGQKDEGADARVPSSRKTRQGEPCRAGVPPSSAQRTRVSRARPLPPSGDGSKALMTMVIVRRPAGSPPWRHPRRSRTRPAARRRRRGQEQRGATLRIGGSPRLAVRVIYTGTGPLWKLIAGRRKSRCVAYGSGAGVREAPSIARS